MSDNLRRALFGSSRRRPSIGEVVGGAVLDYLTKEPEREPNVPPDPTLPVELQGIIESGDFTISVRRHHTKCWLWKKNRTIIKDPISGRSKYITDVIYRIYSGKDVPGGKGIQHKCGQPRCINYEHMCLIKQREIDAIHRIATRSDVELNEITRKNIRKVSERYGWTEKEQMLIFNVSRTQLRDDF